MQYQLGFIGCGNMGGALAQAAAKTIDGGKIAVFDPSAEKMQALQVLGMVPTTAEDVARNAKFLLLAVKPQIMQEALSPIAEILQAREDVVVITIAAGLSIAAIQGYIGKKLPVIRIMPNTPVLVGEGMLLYSLSGVNDADHAAFRTVFERAGVFDLIPEEQIDAGSALSGCGPAFAYAFAQALADGGEMCGLTQEKALLYATQTVLGAMKMLEKFKDSETLIRNVCSPKGTTIEGVNSLKENDLQGVVESAVKASYRRTLELKK